MEEQKKLTGYPSIDKPWLKYYSEEAINAPLPECTIYEYLWENNKDYPDDIAIIYYNRKITYGELFREIDKTASALLALGVKQGEIVTVALPSIPEALYAVYALNKIGAVANMIHPLAGEQELCNYLNEVEGRVFLMFTGTYAIVKDALAQTSVRTAVVVSPSQSLSPITKCLYRLKAKETKIKTSAGLMDWSSFLEKGKGICAEKIEKDCHDMALISHTGGTTGEPKGVMCSDYNINALIYQIICNFQYSRQYACVSILPPFVNYSLLESMMAMLCIGFKVVLLPKYEPMKLGEYIKKHKPYVIFSIPAYLEALLKINDIEAIDMSCLRYIIYGGEAMEDEKEAEINEVLQRCRARGRLLKGVGSTEMMAAATSTFEDCNEIGSAGVPLVWTNCKVVEQGTVHELSYDQEGEICFTGPSLMLGYYHNPNETNAVVKHHPDGQRWLHTGDLGYVTEDGVIYITGRIKRILMTKGSDGNATKIFPDRIEKVLPQHPAIDLCCVIGVQDEVRINYPKAYVVLNSDFSGSEAMTQEIQAFCRDKLPGYMIPDEIEYCLDLPRTSRGKIDYRALEERAAKEE